MYQSTDFGAWFGKEKQEQVLQYVHTSLFLSWLNKENYFTFLILPPHIRNHQNVFTFIAIKEIIYKSECKYLKV